MVSSQRGFRLTFYAISYLQAYTYYKGKEITPVKKNSGGFSPPANYTDRATAACRRS
jgi:hypothetical protein